ncbi:MAG: hypothetical protein HFI68_06080 [Lachnospiraceae bacterium]|nr:hypothetical protein [Lachnospiraceae bacterium]
MIDRMKETFDEIHAEEKLKNKTRDFLARRTRGYTKRKIPNYRILVSAAVCLLFVLAGGYWLYFIPTAEISIDVNPSLELSVNRFDQVVAVCGRNDEGIELADSLSVKYINYAEAIHRILESEKISGLLSDNETLTISVIGPEGAQCARMYSNIESCTAGQKNTHCYFAHSEEVSEAHEMGLSYGKYRAFLELRKLYPDITAEEVRGMTMKEIYDYLGILYPEEENCTGTDSNCEHHDGENGHGHGNGKGHGMPPEE